ncbi:MAG: branched-chain amino acid ABC transporter permease [Anaerolineae bacterium]|nr:branched-chain amino acid ABC transporter permease [Anaerolineae bacterium]MDQ7034729.1 branched-chain amino acid ABC transporter permease [Anaerolineae bacterium]
MEIILRQVIQGISTGMLLFVVSSGLTLVFGVLRVINFAHGSLYMLGAYLAVAVGAAVTSIVGETGAFFVALLIAPILVAMIGAVLEFGLFRRIYGKEHLLQLLLTYGLTLILGNAVRIIWGGGIYRLGKPDFLRGRMTYDIGDFSLRLGKYDLFVIIVGLLIGVGLWFLLQKTRFGRITRAAVNNPDMVSALGINVDRVLTMAFMLGAWLAGIGGALTIGDSSTSLAMDSQIIIRAFAIVVIGGLGSFAGALIGSLLVGIVLSVGIVLPSVAPAPFDTFFSNIPAESMPFIAMALILILRPWGLLGKAER